jgi:hypothetical protein
MHVYRLEDGKAVEHGWVAMTSERCASSALFPTSFPAPGLLLDTGREDERHREVQAYASEHVPPRPPYYLELHQFPRSP